MEAGLGVTKPNGWRQHQLGFCEMCIGVRRGESFAAACVGICLLSCSRCCSCGRKLR